MYADPIGANTARHKRHPRDPRVLHKYHGITTSHANQRKSPKSWTAPTPVRCASRCSHIITAISGATEKNSATIGEGSASANVYSTDESAQKSAVIFAVRKRSVSRVNERLASCDPASEPMPPCRLRKR